MLNKVYQTFFFFLSDFYSLPMATLRNWDWKDSSNFLKVSELLERNWDSKYGKLISSWFLNHRLSCLSILKNKGNTENYQILLFFPLLSNHINTICVRQGNNIGKLLQACHIWFKFFKFWRTVKLGGSSKWMSEYLKYILII